jgi:HD-GYP domain-containing protein (c-di-GMP phosphodiesterase class II)
LPEVADSIAWEIPVEQDQFRAYVGLPLIVKGQWTGVLEIFHDRQLPEDEEWLSFARALAAQVAIAIENARLFRDLDEAHQELSRAYDHTLEGWARTLELRDDETQGHSLRVTKLSVELARALGVAEEEIDHIRRGALLHDIGKIGIPDRILLKPGPLDADEWAEMHCHPEYARNLLQPVPFLRPALDIPYCHHEKWDGTGYPRGLGGVEIPLAARIFAVVDVWDALISDRPYRPAFSHREAYDYIRSQRGRHFDPAITDAFLRLIDGSRERPNAVA